jgi:hypothetical protein
MTERLVVCGGVAVAFCLALSNPAGAHRLDEYLQVTRLTVGVDRVAMEIDLTAGASVADQVFASIDTNRDGRIGDTEGDAYVRRVLDSISISIDGHPASVTFDGRQFPDLDEMRHGIGTIRLHGTVPITGSVGRHELSYRNDHHQAGSVYLVNAMVPTDECIELGATRRDAVQRGMTLEYRVRRSPKWLQAWWSLVALAVIGMLATQRGANVRQRSIWRS